MQKHKKLVNSLSKKAKIKKESMSAKTKTNNTGQIICYTGIGSDSKSTNYTKSEFINLANKTFKAECIEYHAAKQCKPCVAAKKILNNFMKTATPESGYKMPKKMASKYDKLSKKCNTCKAKVKSKNKTCSFDEYIEYSGAELGKC